MVQTALFFATRLRSLLDATYHHDHGWMGVLRRTPYAVQYIGCLRMTDAPRLGILHICLIDPPVVACFSMVPDQSFVHLISYYCIDRDPTEARLRNRQDVTMHVCGEARNKKLDQGEFLSHPSPPYRPIRRKDRVGSGFTYYISGFAQAN